MPSIRITRILNAVQSQRMTQDEFNTLPSSFIAEIISVFEVRQDLFNMVLRNRYAWKLFVNFRDANVMIRRILGSPICLNNVYNYPPAMIALRSTPVLDAFADTDVVTVTQLSTSSAHRDHVFPLPLRAILTKLVVKADQFDIPGDTMVTYFPVEANYLLPQYEAPPEVTHVSGYGPVVPTFLDGEGAVNTLVPQDHGSSWRYNKAFFMSQLSRVNDTFVADHKKLMIPLKPEMQPLYKISGNTLANLSHGIVSISYIPVPDL